MKFQTMAAAIALATALIVAGPIVSVQAAGGGGTTTSEPAKPKNMDLENATKAIQKQDWAGAIPLLVKAAATEPKNADIQNWLGYSYRRSGNHAKAFEHYSAALQLDPKHKGAHEYIGEAYLETNNLAKAEEHAKKLDDLCSFGCQELRDLKAAITAYKKKNNISS